MAMGKHETPAMMNALVSTPSASAVKRTRADLEGVVVTPATTASARKAQRSTSGSKVSSTVHVPQIIFACLSATDEQTLTKSTVATNVRVLTPLCAVL